MGRPSSLRWNVVLLLLVCSSRLAAANPDGPVGSVCVTPRFTVSSQETFYTFEYQNAPGYPPGSGGYLGAKWPPSKSWVAGLDLLIPMASFATLGLGAENVHAPGPYGRTVPEIPGEIHQSLYLEGKDVVHLSVQMRIYVGLSSSAREELSKHW